MTARHPLLSEIPDALLHRATGSAESTRPRRLIAWCEHRGFRPTLAELEDERRRRLTPDGRTTP